MGSKTLPTDFFVDEVQGNYNILLGCNWLHANQCVPSTMHQQLIQWVDDEVKIVPANNSIPLLYQINCLLAVPEAT
jgi:hypothetical protein